MKMKNKIKSTVNDLDTPSNSGRNRVEMLSVHTGQREVAKTGSLSNWRSRMPSELSSTIKSTKSRTRVEAHGN